jgi:TRAP-type C4-dicarboxylate transport system substrate-binding protein
MSVKTIRWVLAHEPLDIFLRAAEKFAARIAETSNGNLNVEILTLDEYSKKYCNGHSVSYLDLIQHLNDGRLELSQMYTHELGKYSKDLRALDMPFLFTDHEHARRVLDGEIGADLLNSISENTATNNVKGLAFTYSGGFTVLAFNKIINTLADLQDLKIRVPHSPIVSAYLSKLGAKPVSLQLSEIHDKLKSGELDGAEVTYRRLYEVEGEKYSKSVLHSNHNIFLTSIIINQAFWNTLDADMQNVIREAAMFAAHEERLDAVADDDVHKEKCLESGIEVNAVTGTLEQQFRDAGAPLYEKFDSYFSPGLIDKIKLA